jgi:hypothetical protein
MEQNKRKSQSARRRRKILGMYTKKKMSCRKMVVENQRKKILNHKQDNRMEFENKINFRRI